MVYTSYGNRKRKRNIRYLEVLITVIILGSSPMFWASESTWVNYASSVQNLRETLSILLNKTIFRA